MKRTILTPDISGFPDAYHALLHNPVFDSSCSVDARVYYVDTDGGLFLKSAPKGELQTEARMNRYFHTLHLGPEVLDYRSDEKDWLLTRRIPGEDCTHEMYLSDPKRLCDTTASLLRLLHEQESVDCPVPDRCAGYLAAIHRNHDRGFCDLSLFPEQGWGFSSPEEAWKAVEAGENCLTSNTLLHGDYCLPNILLDDWKFSGFIDVGRGGVGDRHMDIFWGVWTLHFNLKTNRFYDRFLDAYGRDRVEPDMLRLIAACEVFL